MDTLLQKLLTLFEKRTADDHHRGGAVACYHILRVNGNGDPGSISQVRGHENDAGAMTSYCMLTGGVQDPRHRSGSRMMQVL